MLHSLTLSLSLSACVWLQSLEEAWPTRRYVFPNIAAVNNSQRESQLLGKYPTCRRHRCCTLVFSHLTGWWAGAHCLISQKEPFSRLLLHLSKSQAENPSRSLQVLSLVSFFVFFFPVLLTVWKRFEKQKAHLLCRCTCPRWVWTSVWLLQSWSRRTRRRLAQNPHPDRTSARTAWECWSAGGSSPDLEGDHQHQCGDVFCWKKTETKLNTAVLTKPELLCHVAKACHVLPPALQKVQPASWTSLEHLRGSSSMVSLTCLCWKHFSNKLLQAFECLSFFIRMQTGNKGWKSQEFSLTAKKNLRQAESWHLGIHPFLKVSKWYVNYKMWCIFLGRKIHVGQLPPHRHFLSIH